MIRPEQVVLTDSEISIGRLRELAATAPSGGVIGNDLADISGHAVTQEMLDKVARQGYTRAIVHTHLVSDGYARRTSGGLSTWMQGQGFRIGSLRFTAPSTRSLVIAW